MYTYIETTKEKFDRPEQVDECVIAVHDNLQVGRLVRLDVARVRTRELEKSLTASRMARPAYIAFTGENCCKNRQL